MTNRFERSFQLDENLYVEGAPVIILAESLLHDNVSGMAIGQLKFLNVSEKVIKGVKVGLNCFDMSKEPVEGVEEYQYVGVYAQPGKAFGDDKAIILPNPVAQTLDVSFVEVVFDDEEIWRLSQDQKFEPLAQRISLAETLETELIGEYKLLTSNASKYVPVEEFDMWGCSCGHWNKEEFCRNCETSKESIFNNYCRDSLQAIYQKKKEELELQRAEAKEKQEKTLKIAKKAVIIGAIAFVIIFAGVKLATNVIIPNISYNKACDMLETAEKEDYADIILKFEELGNFKESKDKLVEAKYGYIKSHQVKDDTATYKYLVELSRAKYKDCEQIKETLYKIEVLDCILSGSEAGTKKETTIDTYPNGKDLYLNVKISGYPYESVYVVVDGTEKYKYSFSNTRYTDDISASQRVMTNGQWESIYLGYAYGKDYSAKVTVKIGDYKKTLTIKGN